MALNLICVFGSKRVLYLKDSVLIRENFTE